MKKKIVLLGLTTLLVVFPAYSRGRADDGTGDNGGQATTAQELQRVQQQIREQQQLIQQQQGLVRQQADQVLQLKGQVREILDILGGGRPSVPGTGEPDDLLTADPSPRPDQTPSRTPVTSTANIIWPDNIEQITRWQGFYRIQVGSFGAQANARDLSRQLGGLGFDPEIERNGQWFRVVLPHVAASQVVSYVERLVAVGFGLELRPNGSQEAIWVRTEQPDSPTARLPAASVTGSSGGNPAADMFGRRVDPRGQGSFKVQVSSYTEMSTAQRDLDHLSSLGLRPEIERFNSPDRKLYYRVVIPDVRSAGMAEVLQRLGDAGYASVWIRNA
ncbi:MAG: SPOR domain-containing protein [Treponema sp.]|jgi:cell division protein FtsN|nr:SPOR domain-containing protein [Treponema sp.]